MRPLVSIILPAYNAEEYLPQALDSILSQTYPHWELLACDDASTDNTRPILEEYAKRDDRIILSHNDTNQKLLRTRNRLLKMAKGDYITFQDADDYSDVTRLEKMVGEFERNEHLGLLSSQVGFVDEAGVEYRRSTYPTSYDEVKKVMYKKNPVGGSFMMISRKAFESVGMQFRPYFDGLSYQDYDLSLLIAESYEAYSLPEVLYYYRQHDNSASKQISIDRVKARDLVLHLANQRQQRGSDDLQDGRPELVDAYFRELKKPYLNDPSLIYREYAANFNYNFMYKRAIGAAWRAVICNPLKFQNWRLMQYCLRILVIRFFGLKS